MQSLIWIALFLCSCTTAPLAPLPSSKIEDFMPAPALRKPAVKTYGVDLDIKKTEHSRQLLKESLPQAAKVKKPLPTKTRDLVKLFELEITVGRNHNKEELLDEFINYTATYKDIAVAKRSYELSQQIHSPRRALTAAGLWLELDRSSSEAQNIYIKELILQSKYADAFRLMEDNRHKGRRTDFRLIALFSQVENEAQARKLVQSYQSHIKKYIGDEKNINEGLQIANYKLGSFLFYQKKLNKALRVFNLILSSENASNEIRAGALIFKSRIYYLLNKTSSEPFYEQATADNPTELQIPIYHVLYLMNNNKKEQAEEALLKILPLVRQKANEQHIFLLAYIGQQFNLTRLEKETINYYQYILREQGIAALRLGMLAMKNGNPSLAEHFWGLVDSESSVWSMTQFLRLKIFISTADFASGTSLLNEIFLQDQEAYSSIARQYALELARQGNKKAAISIINEAEKRLPQNEDLFLAKAFVYYESDELAAMIEEFESDLQENPEDPTVLNSYGYSLADKNLHLDKAKKMIEQAVDANPLRPAYVDSLGWVHYRLNNLQRAYELLNWAYRNDQDGEIAAHLGEVLWKLDKRERARVVWLSSYETEPRSAVLRETMTRFNVDWQELNPHIDLLAPDF